ncbi:MAG: DUF371 domain-containing protein [Candidatus Bathyarchaeia archaeon]
MGCEDFFFVYGHPNIRGTHRSTIEFTKDSFCTSMGDCILGIRATKSVTDLDDMLKEELRKGKKATLRIYCGEVVEELYGFGSSLLTFKDERSVVIRKSSFIDSRTLLINANKSARDLNRELIHKMKDFHSIALIKVFVDPE